MAELDYLEIVAEGLKKYCDEWDYDWIAKLKEDSSVKNFRKLFFKITHLFYIHYQNNCYNVTFSKGDNIASVKRCGKDWDVRDIDATIDIEALIKVLVRQ